MKNTATIHQRKIVILLLLFIISVSLFGKDDLKPLSDYLDHIINNKEQFTQQKELEIKNLKKLLDKKDSFLEYNYEINLKLCNEYKKFKLDSAICYCERNVEIADVLNNSQWKYLSQINLASLYSYSGKFLESQKILESIHSNKLPAELLPNYYEAYSRFYEHYATISNQNKYTEQIDNYRDSVLTVLEPSSFEFKINMAHKYISQGETEKAEDLLLNLFDSEDIDSPEYALTTHYLATVYGIKDMPDLEMKYYTMSAIADIKTSIKENASFQRLALIYYNNGDIAKAFRYTQSAIEDAVFSGVQFRTAQMSEFYSIINASYQAKEAKTNSKLKNYLLLISILSLFLILLVGYVYNQMKKLSVIKEKLSLTNNKLQELNIEINGTNDLLNDKNIQLSESNLIKEQYIAQFFNLCSTYIDKMENYRKTLYRIGLNRQYEELLKKLKSTATLDNELDELYKHFDSIFIKLYPTFVSDFNSLLAKEEQITLKSDDFLNKELRIYALLRLGITDSSKIADFLRCSMSTIYNYRTKMRNKAASNREGFEEMVMKIGIINFDTD